MTFVATTRVLATSFAAPAHYVLGNRLPAYAQSVRGRADAQQNAQGHPTTSRAQAARARLWSSFVGGANHGKDAVRWATRATVGRAWGETKHGNAFMDHGALAGCVGRGVEGLCAAMGGAVGAFAGSALYAVAQVEDYKRRDNSFKANQRGRIGGVIVGQFFGEGLRMACEQVGRGVATVLQLIGAGLGSLVGAVVGLWHAAGEAWRFDAAGAPSTLPKRTPGVDAFSESDDSTEASTVSTPMKGVRPDAGEYEELPLSWPAARAPGCI